MQAGLKITLHGGEVANEREVDAMLEFAPDRFGHMCVVTEAQAQMLLVSFQPAIAVAVCARLVDGRCLCITCINLLQQGMPGQNCRDG
jgi:hypothetical protein